MSVKEQVIKFIASGCYAGYSPVIPGTIGTVVGIIFYLNFQSNMRLISQCGLLVGFGVVGIWVCTKAEMLFGKKDSSKVVFDEITGYMVGMFGIKPCLATITTGFLLFRILDVLKPFHIDKTEQLNGGLGIMVDDILCGIVCCVILHLTFGFIPYFCYHILSSWGIYLSMA